MWVMTMSDFDQSGDGEMKVFPNGKWIIGTDEDASVSAPAETERWIASSIGREIQP